MKKRELKRSIVRLIRGGELYGYEIRKILLSEGEKIQLSYLYKTLKEMCDEKLLESELSSGDHGPQTRKYRLTRQGREELGRVFGEATELIHDFYEDYVAKLPPRFFSEKFDMMMREAYGGRKSAALVTSEPLTQLHRRILHGLCGRSGAVSTFLIRSASIRAEPQIQGLRVLDGTMEDIPMKDQSLDAIVVVDLQDSMNLKACCRELRRVLKRGGLMFGCSPFIGLGGEYDPLEVGEFMKRTKYEMMGRAYLDKETVKKELAATFDYVDVANLAFMTAFVAGLKPIQLAA